MSEIDNAIKECDLMIDRIIESDAELKENYAIITSIKRRCTSKRSLFAYLHQQLQTF